MANLRKYSFFYSFILAVPLFFLYFPSLSLFFAQDDYVHLLGSKVQTFSDMTKWFTHHSYDGFYRPLGVYIPVGLIQLCFGLKAFWYHIFALTMHLGNTLVFIALLRQLKLSKKVSFITAFLLLIHPSYFYALTWIAEMSLVVVTFWFLTSLYYYNAYIDKPSYKKILFTVLSSIFALLTNELALIFPILLWIFPMVIRKKNPPWDLRLLLLLPSVIYLPLRVILIPPLVIGTYQPQINLSLIKSILWYLQRSFGLPEYVGLFKLVTEPQFYLLDLLILISAITITYKIALNLKSILAAILWWFAALLPVIFLPEHRLTSYLTIALIGPFLYYAYNIKYSKRLIFGAFTFFAFSLVGFRLKWEENWLVKRSALSQVLALKIITEKIHPQTNLYILSIPTSNLDPYFALAGEVGPQVLTQNNNLKTYYSAFTKQPPKGAYILKAPVLE